MRCSAGTMSSILPNATSRCPHATAAIDISDEIAFSTVSTFAGANFSDITSP